MGCYNGDFVNSIIISLIIYWLLYKKSNSAITLCKNKSVWTSLLSVIGLGMLINYFSNDNNDNNVNKNNEINEDYDNEFYYNDTYLDDEFLNEDINEDDEDYGDNDYE